VETKNFAKDLLNYIYSSPTSFHAVKTSKELLNKNGFKELKLNEKWSLKVNEKYYVTKNSSALIAFKVNSNEIENQGFRIIASHSDSPSLTRSNSVN